MLLSVGRVLGETKSLNITTVHAIWIVNILVMLVSFWWWAISLREMQEWVFLHLLFLLFDVSLFCLLAVLLYPVAIPRDYDLKAHFARKRISFFSILILLAFTDPVTAMILGTEHLMALGWAYLYWIMCVLSAEYLPFATTMSGFNKRMQSTGDWRSCHTIFPGSFQSRHEYLDC